MLKKDQNITTKIIRRSFIDFFKSKDHTIVASDPIVLRDDPTLMFTNSGMNQFKNIFLGYSSSKDKKIANYQKCLRVSGKHNDLEEVGHDTYHHTMFEMLGSWSFGDYFKEEAISLAWEYLTKVCNLEQDRLYVTVFEGDKSDRLEKDNDTFSIWNNTKKFPMYFYEQSLYQVTNLNKPLKGISAYKVVELVGMCEKLKHDIFNENGKRKTKKELYMMIYKDVIQKIIL